jgi:L-threonylcarbamoyladenylate synthase
MRRVYVDPEAPQRDAVLEAAKWIRAGRIVAIPTDTLYGLAVDPFSAEAVERVFEAKGRPAERALPLIAAAAEQVAAHLHPLSRTAALLAGRFWPGPLTLIVPAPRGLAHGVTGGTGGVAVRVPDDGVARAICAAVGRPITATSANVSGQPATANPDDVEEALGARIELLIDAGRTRGGPPSTIVDVVGTPPRLVRAGAVPWETIEACLLHE